MVNKTLKFLLFMLLLVVILIPLATNSLYDLKQEEQNQSAVKLIKEEAAKLKAKKDLELKSYLTGKFDPAKRKDFTLVRPEHKVISVQMYLRKETYAAFVEMREAAAKDDVTLNIASATRNFNYQKTIWENKWNGITLVEGKKLPESMQDEILRFQKILEYSAAPGTSRHHWGTDIDINGADVSYFDTQKGAKEYKWLSQNAPKFGFCQTYKQKGENRVSGYNEEKWHWSYLPLAKDLLKDYAKLIKEEDISGFAGDEYVKTLNLINDYVLSISPECL